MADALSAIPTDVLQNLSDKLYEKRKNALSDKSSDLFSFVRELRRQLFGRYRRRHSPSRSRSRSPYRHRSYEERGHGSRSHIQRYDDRDRDRERGYYDESRSRRHRSTSPLHRRERSRSSEGRRHRSPVREGSEERRAKIEQWNRQREQAKLSEANDDVGINNHGSGNNYAEMGDGYYNQQSEHYEH